MRLPVGHSDFREVINSGFDFVDKSLFIKEIIRDDKIILITRPRRFGKTLNLSMLRYFFAAEVNGSATQSLFDHLAIKKHTAECERYQGKHPVIAFSFKDVKEATFSDAYASICDVVRRMYDEHRYLLESKALSQVDKTIYQSVLAQQATEINIRNSLRNLTVYLRRHHGIEVVVLIDEYDTPIQSGYLCDYYEKVINFFRSFFGAGLKDNEHVFKAVLTGILRVSRESLFSGLNNLVIYSMLDEEYGACFGFTEAEVESLLKAGKVDDQHDQIKDWYNGYQIGEHTLYNPWSIANYIKKRKLQPYWINTSDNALIKTLLLQSSDAFKSKLEPLFKGESVEQLVNQNFVYPQLREDPESALWSFLFMAGYLKVANCSHSTRGPRCKLTIPNREVSDLYRTIIEEWLAGKRGFDWYDRFLADLLTGNMPAFDNGLQYIMDQTVSVHDTAKEPEAFYHGLIIGITASLCDSKTYELRSNRESGDGRYDYFIISRDPDKLSILMEFKKVAVGDNLHDMAKAAVAQIDMKKYLAEARQRGIKKLLKIGIAFSGKKFSLHWSR